ncbi:hypothetical protein BGX27_003617 [Mortierella sp. AM989]|nr:hypothetical protein BGX27_003617 [Mortierella sp. AM989]
MPKHSTRLQTQLAYQAHSSVLSTAAGSSQILDAREFQEHTQDSGTVNSAAVVSLNLHPEIQRSSRAPGWRQTEAPATSLAPFPTVLVQDSEDETDVNTNATTTSSRLINDYGDSLNLSCLGPYFGDIEWQLEHSNDESRKALTQLDSKLSIQNETNEVPDSEDEDQSAFSLDILEQIPLYIELKDNAQSASSYSTSPIRPPLLNPPLGTLPATEVAVHAEISSDGMNLPESPHKFEKSESYSARQNPFVVRSYPLRERTFQQRKPYTADKQQHARLIGSRIISGNSLQSRESVLNDTELMGPQDDEEDADYEEYNMSNVNGDKAPTTLLSQYHEIPPRVSTSKDDFFLQDLDDDDLPTIEDLRRQFQPQKHAKLSRVKINGSRSHHQVNLPPALSARAKRKLEQLALQPVETLDPVDVEPVTSNTNDSLLDNLHHLFNEDSDFHSQSSETTSSVSKISGEYGVDLRDAEDNQGVSDEAEIGTLGFTKKPKKFRQHVLPMAFFKRNLIPDDTAALKSMRSRSSILRGAGPEARYEPDQAHHAKRRIAPLRQGDSLSDFMAQLGQDKSDSEGGYASKESFGSDHHGFYETSDNGEWRRPTLKDTEPYEDHNLSNRLHNRDYQDVAPRYSISSGSERSELQSSDGDNELEILDPIFATLATRRTKNSPKIRGERLDMIDRMTVRSSDSTLPKQHSFTPSSRKRRRLSGDLPSTRIRNPRSKAFKRLSRPVNRPLESPVMNAQSLDLGSDSASSGEFHHDLYNEMHKQIGRKKHSSYASESHAYEDDYYGMDHDSLYEQLSKPQSKVPNRSTVGQAYPIHRYDTTTSRHRPRFLCRAKIVPITRKPKLTGAPNTLKSSRREKSRSHNPKALLQGTLYPHLVGQHPYGTSLSRPQLVNRPSFKAASERTNLYGLTHQRQYPDHQDANNTRSDRQAPVDGYALADQVYDNEIESYSGQGTFLDHEDTIPPALESLNRERFMSGSRDRPYTTDLKTVPISNGVIPSGLYFSRDTYIGRGLLSQILRAMSTRSIGDLAASGYVPGIVFFDRPFNPDWSNIVCVENDLQLVVSEWKRLIQGCLQSRGASDFRSGLHAATETTTNLLLLENMTILLVERLASSFLESVQFWRIFKSVVVSPLEVLAEELQSEQSRPEVSVLLLWMRWSMLAWNILAACMLQDVEESIDNVAQALLRQLIEASDTGFMVQLSKLVNPTQVSQGAIHGQEVLEVWICLIQVLNRYSELRSNGRGFWTLFNRQVLHMWFNDEGHARVAGEESDASASSVKWHDRASHVVRLLRELCKLHQFGRDGSSNPAIQTNDNWDLVLRLLQKNWLDGEPPESIEAEILLRDFLSFCHSRIYIWGWAPCADVIVYIYRYFSNRRFRDMPTEHGHRLPEFLKTMITAAPRHYGQLEPQYSSDLQRNVSGLNLDLLKIVDRHDRCFEIFLKVLAKTVHWQVCSIVADGDGSNDVSTLSGTSPVELIDGPPSQAASYQLLTKAEKIKACKRLLSLISPVVVTTISSTSSSEQTYSSICNPCNLVLIVTLLVPDFIRPSTVGQLRSLLNFEESDDVSRRILLESVFYLGTAWQRQMQYGFTFRKNPRSLETILDYIFGKLGFMCQALEGDMTAMDNGGANYVPRSKRQTPLAALIETTLGHIIRLMSNDMNLDQHYCPYPCIAYLDQGLSRFLNPEIGYSPELRLQALGVVECFLALRKTHESQLRKSLVENSQPRPVMTSKLGETLSEQDQSKSIVDDGFSSLDYDQLVFDDSDFLDSSQSCETEDKAKLETDSSTSIPSSAPVTLPQDEDLVKVMLFWIYPSLVLLIKARHQALHNEKNQQARSTIPANLVQSSIIFTNSFEVTPGLGRRELNPSDNPTSVKSPTIASMSPQGVRRILSVYADCTMVLLNQGCMKMDAITELFKREPWLDPWAQHWRQQDELVWATRTLESSPRTLSMNEDIFLNIWFRTISLPVHELTVQHRFLMAILNVSNTTTPDNNQHQGLSPIAHRHLFKDLPIAHCDYNAKDVVRFSDDVNVDSNLLDTNKDAELFQEFKESRLQIIAKVLSNIGENYLTMRPAAGSVDQLAFYQAQDIKSRYQSYLNLLMNQIKRDYERLELGRMVRESIKHVELAHHVVGQVIQHCGLVMQNSPLVGSHDSILNYLTSSRHFPQPRMDGVFIHQKIRGYAYLHQAGEKQFFSDMLGLVLNHLKLIPGKSYPRFKWPLKRQNHSAIFASIDGAQDPLKDEERFDEILRLKVTDYGMTDYECDYGNGLPITVNPSNQHAHAGTDKTLTTFRTIPKLYAVQSKKSQLQESLTDTKSAKECESPTDSASTGGASSQSSRFPIRTLFANQVVKQQTPYQRSREALRTLTSSLRNVALEAEDRKQW